MPFIGESDYFPAFKRLNELILLYPNSMLYSVWVFFTIGLSVMACRYSSISIMLLSLPIACSLIGGWINLRCIWYLLKVGKQVYQIVYYMSKYNQ